MTVPASGLDLAGRRLDRVGEARLEEAELGVDPRRVLLDEGEGPHHRQRHRQGRYGKVLDGALGLGAPVGPRRQADLPHRVGLEALFPAALVAHEFAAIDRSSVCRMPPLR